MPPYIIFNDKTLIDMCVRSPKNKQEMLAVSGVAENKFKKYGQRFLDEIQVFFADNPAAVISMPVKNPGDNEAERMAQKNGTEEKKTAAEKEVPANVGAPWNEKEDGRLAEEYRSGMKIAEIAREHGRTSGAIRSRLKKQGLIQ